MPRTPVVRRAPLALLCQTLAGCVAASVDRSNDLPRAPAAGELPLPPVAVAFIVHPPFRDNSDVQENKRESEAWAVALGDYAESRRIFVDSNNNPNNMPMELQEFCRTHPVVEVSGNEDPAARAHAQDWGNLGAMAVDLVSLGLIPLRHSTRYVGHFSLVLPGDPASAGDQAWTRDYGYARSYKLSPLYPLATGDQFYGGYFIPVANGCCAGTFQPDLTDWRVEEKRQLVAQFMREVRPRLEQYARQAGVGTSHPVPPPASR